MQAKIAAAFALCTGFCNSHAQGVMALSNPAHNGQALQAYTVAAAFQGNDQVAMRQYGGDWAGDYTPRAGTNMGLLWARAEAGVQWQGYRLGVLRRGEALVEANRDTADLVQQYQTSSGYQSSRTYPLDYRLSGFEAEGVQFSKGFAVRNGDGWRVQAGVAASSLRGKTLKMETISGQVLTLNTKDFNAGVMQSSSNTGLDIHNTVEFNAPNGRKSTFSGQGYTVDVGLNATHQPSGLAVELAVADWYGQMDWVDVPTNVTNYTTATKYYDANGYVHFDPSTVRTSSYRNISQRIEPKVHLAASYPWRTMVLQASTSYTQGYWFPAVGIAYAVGPQWTVAGDVDFRFRTLGVSLSHTWFELAMRTDNTSLDTAKAYGLSVKVKIPL